MNVVIFAFTEAGKAAARRVRDLLPADGEAAIYVPERLAEGDCAAYAGSLSDFAGSVFQRDALIFIGACGIAVRAVAPHVTSKRSDPAVLCLDEGLRFVIPVLSGHIGGANRLAAQLASALYATAVITTATDVNGRFSVDAWAAERGLHIASMALAKRVSAGILTRDIPFCCDHGDPAMPLPEGLVWGEDGELGVCVSVYDQHPFKETLLLVPRALRLGLGCRRGVPGEAVEGAIRSALARNHLRVEAVAGAATIDIKADEPGLNACCREHGWPVALYSAEQLARVPGNFSGSDFVARTVGVDNVCERAATASGGRLIAPKYAENGVTVAVTELEWGVDFG